MLQRIMVPLDGSELAEQTVPFASAVARAFDAEIILLRVVETPAGGSYRALDSFDWRLERTAAIEYLQDVKRRLRDEGLAVDLDVTAGRASEEILELARARDVDLIVLGSHGVGGVSEFRMASTAHKVVFASDMSVLVVPSRVDAAEGRPFETVLVPVDCSPHSDWAVTLSAKLARSEGTDLVVMHVVREPMVLDPQGTEREREIVDEIVTMNRRAASRYIEGVKHRLESPGVPVRSTIAVADGVAPALEREADREERPLLVLSARGRSRFDDSLFGGLVTLMLANTSVPVFVLREPSKRSENSRRWYRPAAHVQPRRFTTSVE